MEGMRMDASTPLVLGVATYSSKSGAETDFNTIWGAKHEGEYDHMAVAVLTKDSHGQLEVDRHDSTAKHLAWGGALLGAALTIVAPPVGVGVLAASGATAGAGGIVGHFHHNIPKDTVRQMGDLLDAGESGLMVVAVNHKGSDIEPLLSNATKKIVVDTPAGDLESAYNEALKKEAAS
jgi:uncharacterized membrane protein